MMPFFTGVVPIFSDDTSRRIVHTANMCFSLVPSRPSPSKLYFVFSSSTYCCCVFGWSIFPANKLEKIFVASFVAALKGYPVPSIYSIFFLQPTFVWRLGF